MGDQLLIIGATGTAKPGLLTQLTALLLAAGLQVRHASRRYQGETEFEIGGPLDLAAELAGTSVSPEQATLESISLKLDAFRQEFREFTDDEEDDKKRPSKRTKAKKPVEEQKPVEEPKPAEQVESEQEQEADKAPEVPADPPDGAAE